MIIQLNLKKIEKDTTTLQCIYPKEIKVRNMSLSKQELDVQVYSFFN